MPQHRLLDSVRVGTDESIHLFPHACSDHPMEGDPEVLCGAGEDAILIPWRATGIYAAEATVLWKAGHPMCEVCMEIGLMRHELAETDLISERAQVEFSTEP